MLIAVRSFRALLSWCALGAVANASAAPVDSGPLALSVAANNGSGISINVVTGATGNCIEKGSGSIYPGQAATAMDVAQMYLTPFHSFNGKFLLFRAGKP